MCHLLCFHPSQRPFQTIPMPEKLARQFVLLQLDALLVKRTMSSYCILRLIEEPGAISCVFQFGGFCCAHDSSWWLPQRRRSQQADRVGARWVGGLSRDAPRQRLGAFA